jgi:Bacterial transglutaminase-like N-terminal region
MKGTPMRRLNISHITEYLFSNPVELLPHRLLLRPRESHNVRIESSALEIFPGHTLQWKRDVLDNSVALVGFSESSDRLRIASNVVTTPSTMPWRSNPTLCAIRDRARPDKRTARSRDRAVRV